ncbi:hypothetical protein FHX37_0887 [Haloactinospora alba]|uniref:Uncharacterized protein n=1 Tax=Haloactinospora alba TaxID=405555 RepID=A0A543NGM0_9ACTN|nr:hypothetical protein [Haloactinospora alba]TQN30998.1 hypothetical protein FHX37_0887 [Haloactinospora alba]
MNTGTNNEDNGAAGADPSGRPEMAAPHTEGDNTDGTTEPVEDEEETTEHSAGFGAAPPAGGILSAESFSVAALLATGAGLVGTRLAEMLASVTAQSQSSVVSSVILGDGVTVVLGVLLGAVSLGMNGPASRPWAQWVAAACVLVGVLFLIGSAAAYVSVPPPAPFGPGTGN